MPFCLMNPGAFLKVAADVVLSSDDDDDLARLPEHDAPTNWDVFTTDDARGARTTYAKATIPGLSKAGLLGSSKPPTSIRSRPYHL
jgi:hypothetical protein